jgi:GrpB-like predicted nucleotidyltransferase (UPF0157 family)
MAASAAVQPFMSQPVYFSNSPEIFQAAEQLYSVVERRINAALPNADIRHVGSTAIYGCLTKGDLDVLVRVDQDGFQEADRALSEMFARNEGSDRTESFSAFADASASPDLGVQLVVRGSTHDKFTVWIDRLNNNDELRMS